MWKKWKNGWWCRIESPALDLRVVWVSKTGRIWIRSYNFHNISSHISHTIHKMADTAGHNFQKKTFHKPTYCHHCSDLLWGLIGQGYICEGKSSSHISDPQNFHHFSSSHNFPNTIHPLTHSGKTSLTNFENDKNSDKSDKIKKWLNRATKYKASVKSYIKFS